ncbi:MAG: hypothetical protein EBS05_24510 [Proteobacteria bacterium]|nr:hypothetical protein [Pseudomonadota bacterium]
MTLAQHTTDVAAIVTAATARDTQQDAVDDARAAREANFNFLSDLGVRAPRAIEGQIAADDDLHGAIDDVRAIEATSQDNAQARIRRVISLWTRVNTQRTGATPPLTALLVGTTTVAHLQTALDNHPILMQTVENEKAELNQKRAALRNAASKVDQNNKRWFAAWEGNFADGTPERDALSQIDTGPQTPEPSPLAIATVTPQAGGHFSVVFTAGGGAHATTRQLLWQVEGVDADFTHPIALTDTSPKHVTSGAAADVTVRFKTLVSNSVGTTESAVVEAVAAA